MKTSLICLTIATVYWWLFKVVCWFWELMPGNNTSIWILILSCVQAAALLVSIYFFGYAIQEWMAKRRREKWDNFLQNNPQIPRSPRLKQHKP